MNEIKKPDCFVGVGLRSRHYLDWLRPRTSAVRWLEAVSENFMSAGRPRTILKQLRRNFPIGLHGVSLSVGSADGLRRDYLAKLRELISDVEPFVVSDHLCWTRQRDLNLHDLLPLPFTDEALRVVCRNVLRAQDFLGRKIALENISSYVGFHDSEMTEWEFLTQVAQRSGCDILLDVNNVYVNAANFGFDAHAYIAALPAEKIVQIHLGGHVDCGTHLFDTHSRPVAEPVWKLFACAASRAPHAAVLVEWDEDVPELSVLEVEAARAAEVGRQHETSATAR